MSDNILFSIIVPVYNRRELVRTTIASVLNQSYRSFELILVDDGSTDDSLEVLKEYESDFVRIFSKKNEERSAARNFGALQARGEYLTFLDSDDLLYENHLQAATDLIQKYPLTNWFSTMYDRLDSITQQKAASFFPKKKFTKHLWKGNFLACQGVFIRREIFNSQLFNPALNLMEDWELWLRLATKYEHRHSETTATSALVLHPERSVTSNEFHEKLESKVSLFLLSVNQSLGATEDYKKYRRQLYSSCYSYIALHLLLAGSKKNSFNYFRKSLIMNPMSIFSRRSAAIVKRLIAQK